MSEFMMYFDRKDYGMIYELFLRRVYHCGQQEDPFGIAGADIFSSEHNGKLDPDTFVGIWTAITLLISQVDEAEAKNKVKKIRGLFEENSTKVCFKRVCTDLFKILDEYKIEEFPHWSSLPYLV